MKSNSLRNSYWLALLALDMAAVVLAFGAAYYSRFYWPFLLTYFPAAKGIPAWAIYRHTLAVLLPFFAAIFLHQGFYRFHTLGPYDEFIQVLKGVTLCAMLTTAMTFFYRGNEYSRMVIFLWALYSLVLLYATRELGKWLLRRLTKRVQGPQRVLVIGSGKTLDALKQLMDRQTILRAEILEKTPDADELRRQLKRHPYAEALLMQGALSNNQILVLSKVCEEVDLPCRVAPDLLELRRGEIILDAFFGIPTFSIRPLSLHGSNYYLKRTFDVMTSFIILFVLSFPLLIISLLIKLDSAGPILYTQDRLGWRERKFKLYKFRTMVADADARLEDLKHMSDRGGPVFKMKNDPRITPLGVFLRKFSIDEIPQIFNVLLGDMSLVGPRPQVLWEAAHYDDYAKKRLRVMPGITGLWQVSGRASLSYEEMINLDIFYIENWSLGLDLKILLRTLPAVFAKEGAY